MKFKKLHWDLGDDVDKNANVDLGAVQKRTNLVDLEKCCKMRILVTKFGVDTAENEKNPFSFYYI